MEESMAYCIWISKVHYILFPAREDSCSAKTPDVEDCKILCTDAFEY